MDKKYRRYYKSNRNKNQKLLWKAFLCVAGLAVLAIIASTYRNYRIRESKEPYVRMEEVYPVMEAFIEVQDGKIESISHEERKEIQEIWKVSGNETEEIFLTYGELLRILEKFPLDDITVLEDYKKTDWYVGVDDWNRILFQMIDLYGNNEIILQEQLLIGDSDYVTDEKGDTLPEGMILTPNGVYENQFWNINDYLFRNVSAVCYQNKVLTIIGPVGIPGEIKNVYLADISENELHLFWNGYHLHYPQSLLEDLPKKVFTEEVSRKIIDIGMDEGSISIVKEKDEYIHGKLLQVTEDTMEIEGYGIYPIDERMNIYRLYSELAAMGKRDLRIGYSFTDFVLEDGKVAACLMIKEEDMDYIRVLLKNSDLAGRYHENFQASCNQECEVIYFTDGIETERKRFVQGERIVIEPDDLEVKNERIKIVPAVLSASTTIESIHRNQGIPSYFGTLEITREEGGLLLVNEVLLEDYLCRVVPSEMPSSYPKDALMAQAICARTYAYGKMLQTGLPDLGAHVDDSAGFQVYNNIDEQAATTEAVKSTHNIIAVYEEEPIGAYYYSTSCGVGSDTAIWHGGSKTPPYLQAREIGINTVESLTDGSVSAKEYSKTAEALTEEETFREWITQVDDSHFEAEEGWYRWIYEVEELDTEHMEEVLRIRYAGNPNLILTQNKDGEFESREIESLGDILDIAITKRIIGGVADELIITGEDAVIKVLSELNIRYVLADGVTKVLRQTGDEPAASSSLPSAFIVIDQITEDGVVTGYTITGGGFGHGVGMSQNGAKNMADLGMTCEEIITFFYPGVTLKTLQYED